MPPPSDHPAFRLSLLSRLFKVEQLKSTEKIPSCYLDLLTAGDRGRFISVTRTDEEISIVSEVEGDDLEATWRCIKIAGPMDFEITGVMCNFSTPLKLAGIPIFAVSTWNTDYVLVPKDLSSRAVNVLKKDGWQLLE